MKKNFISFIICSFLGFSLSAQVHEVTVTDFEYIPRDLVIAAGDTVVWNNILGSHNVNGELDTYPDNPEGFGNGPAAINPWTYTFIFTQPGFYDYQCDPHVSFDMLGTVTVLPKLIITEFMYNDPSGPDSLEFIEIYNAGTGVADMTGYTLAEAVTFTFPDFGLEAGGFVLISKDSVAFENNYDLSAFQWDSPQGLNNNGEPIQLLDAMGNLIDVVTYDDGSNWPDAADGSGPSLVLCNLEGDNNDPGNWNTASTPAGFSIEGIEVLANPGMLEDCEVPGPTQYPVYSIGEVTGNNANGVVDSLGVTCQLQGVVYGVNLRPGGLQFTVIDGNNDGIHVFSNSEDYGYTVTEGDEVILRGVIDQFNGLTQINPDTVWMVSSGNTLAEPGVVTQLGEETESQLIRLNGLTLSDPGQWTNSGSGFNVEVTNGANTFEMRIDADVDIFGTEAPAITFDLVGIGGQFDGSSPYDEGYQVLPRYMPDIMEVTGTVDPSLAEGLEIFPNPVSDQLTVKSPLNFDRLLVRDLSGKSVLGLQDPGHVFQVDLGNLPAGVYFLTFYAGDKFWSEKVSKQ